MRRAAALGAFLLLIVPGAARAAQPYSVSYHAFALPKSGITFANTSEGTWTSPTVSTGFGFSELVASWNAQTPAGTFIRVEMFNGWPGFGPGPLEASKRILARHSEFAVDTTMERYGLTFNPGGYLKRLR